MNVTHILYAQAIRIVAYNTPVYRPALIAALAERYRFVRVPQTATEILPRDDATPTTLEHGTMAYENRGILIKALHIYPKALVVETGATTDDSDIVIDDILAWQSQFVAATPGHPKMYLSQLEFESDIPFDSASQPAQGISIMMSRMVATYSSLPDPDNNAHAPGFRLTGLTMSIDPDQYVLPCDFRVERRHGVSYAGKLYFSQAPLRTQDHVAALIEFERRTTAQRNVPLID